MTDKEQAERAAEQEQVQRALQRVSEPTVPAQRITIAADAKESTFHNCGEQRLRALYRGKKVSRELVHAITQRCYDLRAGAKTKLDISFFDGNEKTRPKGTLVLEPDRGKISPSRIELDGKHEHVTVEYTAPDETIRVSIRAFLAGFARGKIHLHLEG